MSTCVPQLAVSLCTKEQLRAVLSCEDVSRIYIEADCFTPKEQKEAADRIREHGIRAGLIHTYAGPVLKMSPEEENVQNGYDEHMIRSVDALQYFRKEHPEAYLVSDYDLYCMNPESAAFLRSCGVKEFTAPVELNMKELKELDIRGAQLIIYGYLPMMVTAQCLRKNTGECTGKSEIIYIKDRKGMKCPVRNVCSRCYNVIYNPLPLSLGGVASEVRKLSPHVLRISLTVEDGKTSAGIVSAFSGMLHTGKEEDPVAEYTRGHFLRGVE